jgi:hypothetical protein
MWRARQSECSNRERGHGLATQFNVRNGCSAVRNVVGIQTGSPCERGAGRVPPSGVQTVCGLAWHSILTDEGHGFSEK